MATNVKLVNITRKPVRIGTTQLAGIGPAAPTVVTVDLESLGSNGRHNLMDLLRNGSVIPSASATSTIISYIAPARSRARIGATLLADRTQTTINLTTQSSFARRDLINLLASGSLLVGDSSGNSSVTLYNISSKSLRVGTTVIPPFRTAASYRATDVITLTNEVTSAGFKLTYNAVEGATVFVNGTNTTTAAIQTALRTATGDNGLVVTGTVNTGPFTVTYSDGFKPLSPLSVTSASAVQTITLTGDSGVRQFKLTYNAIEGATAFIRGTNQTAAAIQIALRTATSDTGLLVSGTTDAGPFTLVFASGFVPLSDVTVSSATAGLTGVTADVNLSGAVVESNASPASAQVTDVTVLTAAQRMDLQWLLAAGQIVPLA